MIILIIILTIKWTQNISEQLLNYLKIESIYIKVYLILFYTSHTVRVWNTFPQDNHEQLAP